MARSPVAALFPVVILIAGCGPQHATVTGDVSYEGTPVAQGVVTLLPADGKGGAASGDIGNGKFKLENVQPGPKVVQVTATREVPFARSSEDMARRYAEAKARGNATGLIDPADVIPADAEGNNQTMEVSAGAQNLTLALKKPRSKK
jgi:hypothetical protein